MIKWILAKTVMSKPTLVGKDKLWDVPPVVFSLGLVASFFATLPPTAL
jgi:hypothetical protein